MDAHPIVPRLWQGSMPMAGPQIAGHGFDVLVLCAEEYQPPAEWFPGVRVIYAPNRDDYERAPTSRELAAAKDASKLVAMHVMSGDKVLVTCMAGRNRSGLVTALALKRLYGMSGKQAILLVRERRKHVTGEALSNPHFIRWLTASDTVQLASGRISRPQILRG